MSISLDEMEIHTSTRKCFKRCRRKWYLRSVENLQEVGATSFPLWFGTGFHWALEDYHGYNIFDTPMEAFIAYYNSFDEAELPPEAEDSIELAKAMLEHYTKRWLPQRGGEYKTLYINGEPQVEVDFHLELPALSEDLGIPIEYKGTFDRVVIDSNGNLWVEDYKTSSRLNKNRAAYSPQVSLYKWAGESWYDMPIEGVLLTQFIKKKAKPPRVLKDGSLSVAKNQNTTYGQYKEALDKRYSDGEYPKAYREMLGHLAQQGSPEGDQYIWREEAYRNTAQARAEYQHIWQEVHDMARALEKGHLYPNPTRDCSWDCDFQSVCMAMDDGGDYEHLIETMYEEQPPRDERPWRKQVQKLKEEYYEFE